VENLILHLAGNLVANHHRVFQHHASIRDVEHTLTVGPLVAVELRRDIRGGSHVFFLPLQRVNCEGYYTAGFYCVSNFLFIDGSVNVAVPVDIPTIIAQVHVKDLATEPADAGHREPHVSRDLRVALVALAGFVVHGGYYLTGC